LFPTGVGEPKAVSPSNTKKEVRLKNIVRCGYGEIERKYRLEGEIVY